MKVRLAKAQDKDQVLKLLDELGEEINRKIKFSPHNTEAQKIGGPIFEEVISRKDTFLFVAEDNGIIEGVLTFYLLPNMRHGGHRGHVEYLVVGEKYRHKGIGTKLFNEMKNYCRKNGIKVIKLDSGIELTDAHKFYQKMGGKFTEKMFRFDLN